MSAAEQASERSKLIEAANDQRTRFSNVMDKVRLRADASAKALAALGSTVVTAFGISKFADLYPYPEEIGRVWWWLVVLAFLIMAGVLGFVSLRLFRVNQPIVMRTREDDIRMGGKKLTCDERKSVHQVYDRMADLNGVASLAALEARAQRFQRIADVRPDSDPLAQRLREQAALIGAEVKATMSTAAMDVVRRRSFRAVADRWAYLAYALFAVAILSFGITADYIASEREDPATDKKVEVEKARVDFATACATAATARIGGLPEDCHDHPAPASSEATTPNPAQADAALVELATKLSECRTAAIEAEEPLSSCAPIKDALQALLHSLS